MKLISRFLSILTAAILCFQCAPNKKVNKENIKSLSFEPGPSTLVYKTRKDHSNHVAIMMNEEKTEILGFPHPQDVSRSVSLAKPSALQKGFWLDNQGINKNSVFTSYSYEEYAALRDPPSIQELWDRIIDKDPFISLCNCGNRNQFENIEREINKLIDQELEPCKKIK